MSFAPSYAWRRFALICLGVLPALYLPYGFAADQLGANPIEKITHTTGLWSLRWLVATLAVTPLRQWLGWRWLAPHRRSLGLLSFFYAVLHVATYAVLDRGLAFDDVWEDVAERPYITVGSFAFLCLVPLAVTSTRGWVRRLGRRWITLHRLAYAAAVAGVIHFLWLVKADHAEPATYAALFALLFAARIAYRVRPATARTQRPSRARA